MKKSLLLLILLCSFSWLKADEGMWIPLLLKYNEAEMQQLGFKLTAEDVYSVNKHSMKDAIVIFGGGCTGELISENGLLLTNHHCGYSYIQKLSTLEKNYLHDGFWAQSAQEELPVAGLTVTFLIRMEDVTQEVLEGVTTKTSESERENIISRNISILKAKAVEGTHYQAIIKPFFYGNQYFLFVNEIFKDVRLVGTPPESIGKFGGDTDNWMWPRHTGDFSIYRIYTDKDGKPATYNAKNIPLKSKKFFSFSLKGVEENDFTLVFGYPGSTQQFLISDEVDIVVNTRNPVAIKARDIRLNAMKHWMEQSSETRLMYSAKANSISNGWKKWIGENKGLVDCNVINRKKNEEKKFEEWINESADRTTQYGSILPNMRKIYKNYKKENQINIYNQETILGVELLRYIYYHVLPVINYAKLGDESSDFLKAKEELLTATRSFWSNYHVDIDKQCFMDLLSYYFTSQDPELIPPSLHKYINVTHSTLNKMWSSFVSKPPYYLNQEQFIKFVESASSKQFLKLEKQEVVQLVQEISSQYLGNYYSMKVSQKKLEKEYRLYTQALMEKEKERVFYPDANFTMRITYGQVQGFSPHDGMSYLHYTTSDGILDKEDPEIYDYIVNPQLKKLFEVRNFGPYANKNGELPIAFIASNHTTGGNSGSPVINANGELIGINFDRVWEGTMSDINYDVSRCRNISLDVRYLLFIIDKFAEADYIMKEISVN